MINTTNQTVLSLLATMKVRGGINGTAITTVTVEDAQTLVDFVNSIANSVESGLAALTISMQNAGGLTGIADIITAATAYDTFMYQADAPATVSKTSKE